MISALHRHFRHHARFYAAAVLGAVAWAAAQARFPAMAVVVGGTTFFCFYLTTTAIFALGATADDLRDRARYEDEGMVVIVFITVAAIVLSLASIFSLLSQKGQRDTLHVVLAAGGVLLGWLTLHTIAAFHYAHTYYTRSPLTKERPDAGGLAFPDTREPATWDFLYYSFVIGMTAQVSDVDVTTVQMRKLTLAHGIASFFFNTVLLALAVNVAAG
ncbi:MAG: DUF1345 domain-containing protein [Rhodospirillales bacterium]